MKGKIVYLILDSGWMRGVKTPFILKLKVSQFSVVVLFLHKDPTNSKLFVLFPRRRVYAILSVGVSIMLLSWHIRSFLNLPDFNKTSVSPGSCPGFLHKDIPHKYAR